MLWLWLTLAAAFVQNARFMLQKRLSDTGLSAAGATFARFLWSTPVIAVLLWGYLRATGAGFPQIDGVFLALITLGGATQILATLCVILLFSHRNFAIGTSFKRTETLQAAIIGTIFLGDHLPVIGWVLIALSLIGVLMMSKNPLGDERSFFNRSTGLGLASGLFFGICAVAYRGAALRLEQDDMFVAALTALAFAVWVQFILLLGYFALRDRDQIMKVVASWRLTSLVSVTSLMGSGLLFSAFTIQNAAYVGAAMQFELIFAALGSWFIFKERITWREGAGMVVLSGAIVLLFLLG